MSVKIGLNIVIASVLGFLAILCLVAHFSLKRNAALAWLSAALAAASAQTVVMTFAPGTRTEMLTAPILVALSFVFAGQSIHALGTPGKGRWIATGMALTLALFSWNLSLLDAPYFYAALLLNLAGTIAMADATWQMLRLSKGRVGDWVLIISVAAIAVLSAARLASIPLVHGTEATFVSVKESLVDQTLLSVSGVFTPFLIILLLSRIISETVAAYQRQSERDALTGLLNRRGVDALASAMGKDGGAVIFCDIDHFKTVNDRFGHQAGDEVIKAFARILAGAGYPAGRMGGEEFAVILEGHTLSDAIDLAEMFRARLLGTSHAAPAQGAEVTASFGVAEYGAGSAPQSAFATADRALYRAKRDGRNRVTAEPGSASGSHPVSRHVA
jgi:diguanylate cyclase (GGDEF)-like protein